MKQYINALQTILARGTVRENRTGVNTISVFGHQERFNLQEGFPATTTKKLAWRSVVSELLWFLEGSGDERRLAEIRWNDERKNLTGNKTIWTANGDNYQGKYPGDLGRIYGVQWRGWGATGSVVDEDYNTVEEGKEGIDQIANLIHTLKTNPNDRRMILTAWNPGELDQMALPPCHLLAQFNVRQGKFLDCQMYQRSCDAFLGVPFNIASYALLTHMIAQVTGLIAGDFIHTYGDLHIYENHLEQVKEQLTRDPLPLPKLWINSDVQHIDDFCMEDFVLQDYEHHPAIHGDMAV
jgi:thymidylate synthase